MPFQMVARLKDLRHIISYFSNVLGNLMNKQRILLSTILCWDHFEPPNRSKFRKLVLGQILCNVLICNLISVTNWPYLLQELIVCEMCSSDGEACKVPWTATPSMDLFSAQNIMNRYEVNQIPVVTEHSQDQRGHLVGLLDRECISLTCRYQPFTMLLQPCFCLLLFFKR